MLQCSDELNKGPFSHGGLPERLVIEVFGQPQISQIKVEEGRQEKWLEIFLS